MILRKANAGDASFIKEHAYRLLDFELSSWREPERAVMTATDINENMIALNSGSPEKELFIAEDDSGNRVGFLHMIMATDYYTKEKHAHLTDIVVTKDAEGKGVGRFLMEQADLWARNNGARWITLNVLTTNHRAMAHYEKMGYKQEWVKYLKEL